MTNLYPEPELTHRVQLCNKKGLLNPKAVGWSRYPLHECNLSGHWLRKKRWNYWAVVSPTHLFSVTLSDVDYLGLPFLYLMDFSTQDFTEKTLLKPLAAGVKLPPTVDGDVIYSDPVMPISMRQTSEGTHLVVNCSDLDGKPLEADLIIHQPQGHQSLNVVIPWSQNRFQFTSKQNTLPTEGTISWGDQVIQFSPNDTFACLDYGRGIWPFECF
jgi:hypothetical protein